MIRQTIKKILSPTRQLRIKRLYYRLSSPNKIAGRRGNTLLTSDAVLKHCRFIFHGKNNIVKIGGVIRCITAQWRYMALTAP